MHAARFTAESSFAPPAKAKGNYLKMAMIKAITATANEPYAVQCALESSLRKRAISLANGPKSGGGVLMYKPIASTYLPSPVCANQQNSKLTGA